MVLSIIILAIPKMVFLFFSVGKKNTQKLLLLLVVSIHLDSNYLSRMFQGIFFFWLAFGLKMARLLRRSEISLSCARQQLMPPYLLLLLVVSCASAACLGGAPNGIIEGTEEWCVAYPLLRTYSSSDDGTDALIPDGCTNCKVDAGFVCWLDASLTKSVCSRMSLPFSLHLPLKIYVAMA